MHSYTQDKDGHPGDRPLLPCGVKVLIPMKPPRHSDLMAPGIPT
jgi:hypothetical protein